MTNNEVTINKTNFKQFKRLYNNAIRNNRANFNFEGLPVLVSWAKYAIEYIEKRGIKAWQKKIKKYLVGYPPTQ